MIYVIGERPSPSDSPASSERMAQMIGVDRDTFLATVRWMNLLDLPPEHVDGAVRAVEALAHPGDAIVLLGRDVARAWRLDDAEPLSTIMRGDDGPAILLLPHPSGLNRWYNDSRNSESAKIEVRRVWREYR